MQIEEIEPRTVTYRLTPDREDGEYHSCMWARYIFDCDNGRLNINSDAGDFSYGWGHNVHEEFMHLMGRVDGGYLLNKLSRRSEFNIAESKAGTIRNIREYGPGCMGMEGQEQLEAKMEEIQDIDGGASEETLLQEVYDIIPGIDWEYIEIVKEYPYGAVIVVEMFMKYLQPVIKERYCRG